MKKEWLTMEQFRSAVKDLKEKAALTKEQAEKGYYLKALGLRPLSHEFIDSKLNSKENNRGIPEG